MTKEFNTHYNMFKPFGHLDETEKNFYFVY